MKTVTAIIKPFKLEESPQALDGAGIQDTAGKRVHAEICRGV